MRATRGANLLHVLCADGTPTAAQWRRYWPTAFADALALTEQATVLRGPERRAHLARAAALVVSVFEGGAPRGKSRARWLRDLRRATAAIKALSCRPIWRLALRD